MRTHQPPTPHPPLGMMSFIDQAHLPGDIIYGTSE